MLLLLLLQARSDVKRLAEELALAHKQISSSRSKADKVWAAACCCGIHRSKFSAMARPTKAASVHCIPLPQ
jgi:hypothetical protein